MIEAEIQNRKTVWFHAIHISLADFMFGYSLGVFNPCLENVSYTLSWTNSEKSLYSNLFSTSIPVGALFGASIMSYICQSLGRKRAFLLMDIIMIIASVLSAMPSTVSFGIGRLLTGLGVGMGIVGAPIFVGETTPSAMKSSIGPILGIMIAIGTTVSYAFGLALPTDNYQGNLNHFWQFMMSFLGLVAAYQAIVMTFFFKYDSPVYYLQRGDSIRYKRSLSRIFKEEDVQADMDSAQVKRDNNESHLTLSEKISLKTLLCDRNYCKMVRVGAIIASVQQFSGINAVIFYSSSIFQNLGISISLARFITFFLGISNVIACICTIPLLKCMGRKPSLVSGQLLLGIDLLITGLLSQFQPSATAGIATCICIFFVLFSYSLQATMWTYFGEILNSTALSYSTAMNFIANIIVLLVFPYAVDAFGIAVPFYFFAISMAFGSLYAAFDLFETKGMKIEEIELEVFGNATKIDISRAEIIIIAN